MNIVTFGLPYLFMITIFSVMDKLPPVSYIRMVDTWLITVQLLPFIFVVLTTVGELLTDSDSTNHHGHDRMIENKWLLGINEKRRYQLAKFIKLMGKTKP